MLTEYEDNDNLYLIDYDLTKTSYNDDRGDFNPSYDLSIKTVKKWTGDTYELINQVDKVNMSEDLANFIMKNIQND